MENFDDFMLHKVKTDYQPNGFNVQFGGGYSFDTDGGYPPLKKFTLTFEGYKYYMKNINGVEVVDTETNKDKNNMGNLEAFYLRHLTNKTFEYNTPVYGKVYVRFAEPLHIPDGIPGGRGVVEKFEISLKEVFA